MIDCRGVDTILDRYLDGETTVEERAGVEDHLNGCAACSRLLAERRSAMGLLAEWAGSAAPATVRPAPRLPWLRLAAAAAVLAAGGILAWQLLDNRPGHTQGPARSGHQLVMRAMNDGVTVLPGQAGQPDELVVDAFPVQLCWQPMSEGVKVVRGESGAADELIVDPFPIKMRPMSSGVVMVSGRSGEPAELVVDPFPEEGK
ncbi:MAG TPA: anti-sigma factor [Planctomycetota bacterium]|nr:anti-sigma factor [Planctomycetota bacterium]